MNSVQYSVNEALESNKRLKQTGALLLQYKISHEMQSLGRSLQIFFFPSGIVKQNRHLLGLISRTLNYQKDLWWQQKPHKSCVVLSAMGWAPAAGGQRARQSSLQCQ